MGDCTVEDAAYNHASLYTAILDASGKQYQIKSLKTGTTYDAQGKPHLWVGIVLDASPTTPNSVPWSCETVLPAPLDTVWWQNGDYATGSRKQTHKGVTSVSGSGHGIVEQYAS